MADDPDIDLPEEPLPVSVLTGFLGSGKTTLLRHLLADPAMEETAVIVNEFGEIGRKLRNGGDRRPVLAFR